MNISQKRKWRSSEEIAIRFLEENGFKVIDRNVKVVVNGIEVGEADAVVEDDSGEKYVVEVKAGSIDVNGIRQAYVNSQLLGCKPIIVAKSFADEAAEALANELGVKTYLLSDQFIVDAEELETIVYSAVWRVVEKILEVLSISVDLQKEDEELLSIIVKSRTVRDLADKLGSSIEEAMEKIKKLQDKNVLNKETKNYQELRLEAKLVLFNNTMNKLQYLVKSFD